MILWQGSELLTTCALTHVLQPTVDLVPDNHTIGKLHGHWPHLESMMPGGYLPEEYSCPAELVHQLFLHEAPPNVIKIYFKIELSYLWSLPMTLENE